MQYPGTNNTLATGIWIFLVLLTLFSYELSAQGYAGNALVLTVLATALLKGQLIIDRFMMLKSAPLMWRMIISLWLLVVLVVIAGMYYAYG